MRVLLAEDNDQLAAALGRVLTRRTLDVVRVADGVAARELLEGDAAFDVVISDVDMPRLGGLGLLRWLHANRGDMVRRCVFMTGEPGTPAAREIALTHSRPVLIKPVAQASLFAAIDAILSTS